MGGFELGLLMAVAAVSVGNFTLGLGLIDRVNGLMDRVAELESERDSGSEPSDG